jgi:hypothetical protein
VHKDFSDWYRIASIDQRDVDLKARWDAVEAFAKDSSVDDLANGARLFYGLPLKDPEFLNRFRAPFNTTASQVPRSVAGRAPREP